MTVTGIKMDPKIINDGQTPQLRWYYRQKEAKLASVSDIIEKYQLHNITKYMTVVANSDTVQLKIPRSEFDEFWRLVYEKKA